MEHVVHGKVLVAGEATGPALVSNEALSFWGGYDQLTGRIIDTRHPLHGQVAQGCVLAIPASRGSSTTTAVLLEAVRNGTHPVAIVCNTVDRFLALASIVAGEMYGKSFPVLALQPEDFSWLANNDRVTISLDGTVRASRA